MDTVFDFLVDQWCVEWTVRLLEVGPLRLKPATATVRVIEQFLEGLGSMDAQVSVFVQKASFGWNEELIPREALLVYQIIYSTAHDSFTFHETKADARVDIINCTRQNWQLRTETLVTRVDHCIEHLHIGLTVIIARVSANAHGCDKKGLVLWIRLCQFVQSSKVLIRNLH